MSNEIVQAQYDALDSVAQRFAQGAEAQRQLARAVGQAAAPLHNGGWIGRGSLAFFDEMEREVSPALERLIGALQEGVESTRQMVQAMREAEEAAARLFAVAMGVAVPPGVVYIGDYGDTSESAPNGGLGRGGMGQGVPPPRVYVVNGINSAGNVLGYDRFMNPIYADGGSAALERLLEGHGFDADQVRSTPAIYLMPHGTNMTGTALGGTQLGGLLSPVDWLTGAAASGINMATSAGADMVNSVTGAVMHNQLTGSLVGGVQVLGEYIMGEQGAETQKTYAWIQEDLRRNPLLPGQSIVLVGHSGGGAIVANLSGMIERNLGQNVSGVVTAGSPLADYSGAKPYAETIVEIEHSNDWVHHIGAPFRAIESVQSAFAPGGIVANMPTDAQLNGPWYGQILEAHGSYMRDQAMAETLGRIYAGESL